MFDDVLINSSRQDSFGRRHQGGDCLIFCHVVTGETVDEQESVHSKVKLSLCREILLCSRI